MNYPKLRELKTIREWQDEFRGYNHNLRIDENEFYEMTNLSSDHYPLLSPRGKRGIFATPNQPQGMIAKDGLCYIDGTDFVMDHTRIAMDFTIDTQPKTLISMGVYVIIMPDKKYINTMDITDRGNIEAIYQSTSAVEFTLCKSDGTNYENVKIQTTEPENPENLALWLDISEHPYYLKQFSGLSESWNIIPQTYIKITAPGIGLPFSEGDGVQITGITDSNLKQMLQTSIIQTKNHDFLVCKGILEKKISQTNPITVTRKMPDMDFIIESGNRLWGCRYGTESNGKTVNALYASKSGDFRNWYCLTENSDASYMISVGTDGPFTGAVTHLGYPIFFKENCIHKIYGNAPTNFQIQTTALRGVQKGCSRSIAIVNEVLYYKSRSSICAYDGSLPLEISFALGDLAYHHAVAGTLGNKYYISMADSKGDYHLFVYDTVKKMWHKEDDTEASDFCHCGGDLYYIDRATNQIRTIKGTGVIETTPIRWSATTGIIGTDMPDKKYISRMDVRMKLDVGARAAFYAEYDSSGDFEYLFTMTGKNLQSFSLPIRPKRCDHLRLRIVGTGEAKIFSICKTIEWGSDL